MAWLIAAVTEEFGRRSLQRWGAHPGRSLVGANLVNENRLLDRQPELLDVLAGSLDEIADETGAQIVFFANEVREDPCFDKAAATRVIGRMKVADLCWDMGWSASVAPTPADEGRVAGLGRRLRTDRARYDLELQEAVERMRGRALRNVIALEALTGGRGAAMGARSGPGWELQ